MPDVAVRPSTVAEIVTGPPAFRAVTTPVALTDARAESIDAHAMARPAIGLPVASSAVAVS